jgi:dihydroneopterin aldolase
MTISLNIKRLNRLPSPLNFILILFVALNNIELKAGHGLYPAEKILGNHFVVNVKVGVDDIIVNSINDTLDYSMLLRIIQDFFKTPTPLLETLVYEIEKQIMIECKGLKYLYLSIQKLHPPLQAVLKSSEVILEKRY